MKYNKETDHLSESLFGTKHSLDMKREDQKLDHQTELSYLYSKAESQDHSSFDQRHLDNAYNAVNIRELQFVIENTESISIKDYAFSKLVLFGEKIESKFCCHCKSDNKSLKKFMRILLCSDCLSIAEASDVAYREASYASYLDDCNYYNQKND